MSFYVGQKVVCVRAHSEGVLIVNRTYTVTAVTEPCSCGPLITVGITAYSYFGICRHCGRMCRGGPEWEFSISLFRPLDELEQQLERIESEPVEELEYA